MARSQRDWTFKVECSTYPGEVVCLTGSCQELGFWKMDQVVPMSIQNYQEPISFKQPCPRKTDRDFACSRNVWLTKLSLPDGVEISYRYCVCVFAFRDQDDANPVPVVRRWETSFLPRKVPCHGACPDLGPSFFGVIPGASEGSGPQVQRGWMRHEMVVELKVFGPKAVNVWKSKHQDKRIFVKVTPVQTSADTSGSIDQDESLDISQHRQENEPWPIVEVATLTEEDCVLQPQSQFGIEYKDDSFILFRVQLLDFPTVAFLVDIFARPRLNYRESDPAEHLGSCYVLPTHFKATEGKIQVAIVSKKFQPIGQLTTNYVVFRPMKEVECDFEVSFSKYWKPHWKGLDVGHRGLGNSYTVAEHCSTIRENTVASLKNAVSHGADMVEFDVQLSHDLVPVVYHDFELLTSICKKTGGQQMMVQMPLKNLTLEQLQQLQIFHPSEQHAGPKDFHQVTDEEHQAFPTLELVLNTIDIHAGFNIELKYDMELIDGTRESHNAFEINLFVDTVLKTVFDHAGERKIVFSSFNPDVCTAVRVKQNRYPVLFLTQGVMIDLSSQYADPRTHRVINGSLFVAMTEILGINVVASDLLRDPTQIIQVKENGQVLFCYIEGPNLDANTVQHLKSLGVDGIIYDRMDWNNPKEVKESIFLAERLDHTMKSSSNGSCNCSPPRSLTDAPN